MKITPIYSVSNSRPFQAVNTASKTPETYETKPKSNSFNNNYLNIKNVSFSGLMRIGDDLKPVDSSFFRDIGALKCAADILKKNFPNGTQIFDYGCSDGEEALSIYMLLAKDAGDKFKIKGIDINEDTINLANQGIYSLFTGSADRFLIPGEEKTPAQDELSKIFYETMEPAKAPDSPLNNSPEFQSVYKSVPPKMRKQIFFKPKDEIRGNFEFKTGDIFEIDKEPSNGKVGAVFFRNAFYHLMNSSDAEDLFTGNIVNSVIEQNKDKILSKEGGAELLEMLFSITTLDEKQQIADEIIDKAYDRLDIGGVFVLGNSSNECIFIAEDSTPNDETVRFGDTEAFIRHKEKLENFLNKDFGILAKRFPKELEEQLKPVRQRYQKFINQADIRILKKTPMQRALERDGRFVPVHNSPVSNMPGVETPTVWVKVK